MSDWRNADYGKNFLNSHNPQSGAFFLGVGIFHPHAPWFAPKSFYDAIETNVSNIILPPYVWNDGADSSFFVPNILTKPHSCYAGSFPGVCPGATQGNVGQCLQWKETVRAYLASIYYADYAVGHILNALENSPHAQSTVVVLAGDHGWSLGEKDQKENP